MSELPLSETAALSLAGTVDNETDFPYHSIGESAYYLTGLRQRHRVLSIVRPVNALRVFRDGAMTFGVRPGTVVNGDAIIAFGGASAQAMTPDATNYVYLSVSGGAVSLQVDTSGFPDPSQTAHIPLAAIATDSESYSADAISDCRERAMYAPLHGVPAAALRERLRTLALTGTDNADGTGQLSVKLRDGAGNDLAQKYQATLWITETDASWTPVTQSDFSVQTGTQIEEVSPDAKYVVGSDASGQIAMNVSVASDKTVYLCAVLNGVLHCTALSVTGA